MIDFISLIFTLWASRRLPIVPFNVDVHACVLISNLLLLKENDANLFMAMQWFDTSYTHKIKMPPIETLLQRYSGGEFNIGKKY